MTDSALRREEPEYQGNLLFTRIRTDGTVEVARAAQQISLYQLGNTPESLVGLRRLLEHTDDRVIVHNFRQPRSNGGVIDASVALAQTGDGLRKFDVISTGADLASLSSERNFALAQFYDTLLVMRSFAQQTGTIPHRILLDPMTTDMLAMTPQNAVDFAKASVAPHELPRLVITDMTDR